MSYAQTSKTTVISDVPIEEGKGVVGREKD